MKRSYEVLHSDSLTLAVEVSDGEYFEFGSLTYTVQSDGRYVYIFDVDESKYRQAQAIAGGNSFPGFDESHGWCQRHDKEIAFVYERTYHPRREDLAEMLLPWGMTTENYSKWELLKRTKGAGHDKWRVLAKTSGKTGAIE